MSVKGAFILPLFLLSILLAINAIAQTDTILLKNVEVKGTVPSVKPVAVPVQQITQIDFKRYSAFNAAEAIKNFSGVNIKDYGGIGGLKTVSIRSLGASHTGVTIDGVAVSNAQNGQVDLGRFGLDNIREISLYNIQSPDICQPAKNFASASVLALKTTGINLDEAKPFHLKASLRTGSFGLINPALTWQQRINKLWHFSLYNNFQRANGRYKYKVDGDGSDTLASRINSDINSLETHVNLIWTKSDSNKLSFRINNYSSERGLPGAVVFYNPFTNQRAWNKEFFSQVTYDRYFNSKIRLLLNSKVARNFFRYLDPDFQNTEGELDQRFTHTEIYNSLALSYKLRDGLLFSYSSDINLDKLKSNLLQFSYPKRYTWYQAVAGRFLYKGLQIQGSLLNTIVKDVVKTGPEVDSRSVFSPTLLISYSPVQDDLILRASYKDIFRNPTFNDLYFTRTGERNLKPEFAEQYNLGIAFNKNFNQAINNLSVSADAYYNKVTDKIIAAPNKDLGTWSMYNLGRVDILGLDAALKTLARFAALTVLVNANYTYQYAVDVTDSKSSIYLNQIPYTPKHTFSSNLSLMLKKIDISYNHIYSSSRYYTGNNLPEYHVPGFSISDASVVHRARIFKAPALLAVEVNNVFNKSYSFIRSFPMPGRSVRLSVQITIN